MQRKDLIIGAIVLVVIAAIVFFIQRRRQEVATLTTPTPTPSIEETEGKIEDRFRIDVPENVEKANLQDPSGQGFSGIATRDVVGNSSELTVLVDLPELASGQFYQAWVRNGTQVKSLGRLRVAKGGFLLDTTQSGISSFNDVVVSRETKDDGQIEEVVLQGSF